MKVPFRLRRSAEVAQADGLLLLSQDVAELLRLCDAMGGAALPLAFAVAGGFLVKLARPAAGPFPGALRLRALAPDLFVPVDAELVPALLDDERAALVRDRGLVLLPGGRALAFAPRQPLGPADLIAVPRLPGGGWRPLPARPDRPERLFEVLLERPEDAPDAILETGAGDVGTEAPRPPESGAPARAAGQALAGAGRGLVWLGGALGWAGLAGLGASLVGRAVSWAPRLGEAILGKQEAALRELLRQFREGSLEDALRRALPLKGNERGAILAGDANLPMRNVSYDLHSLLGGSGGGPGSLWVGPDELYVQLEAEYRKAAEAATQRGDYRRAAFIYGKLLHDYALAAGVLAQGGLHHDAALIYWHKVGDRHAAAHSFEAAGEIDRALALYRELGEHALAGDLLRRAGEEELALAEYRIAAAACVARGNHLRAGEIFLEWAGRPDLAEEHFAAGWAERPGGTSLACLMRLAPLMAQRPGGADLLRLVEEATTFFGEPGREPEAGHFYNELAGLADRPHLSALRQELRDRALLGLATKLRQGAEGGRRGSASVSALLGQSGRWAPSLVRDAEGAVRGPARGEGAATCLRLPTLRGSVTAVCSAPATGDVFLGFAGREVVCYQPADGKVADVSVTLGPVLALATDATARVLLILSGGAAKPNYLTLCDRGPTGPYREGRSRPVELHGGGRLTPVTVIGTGEHVAGLWNGRSVTMLRGPLFLPAGEIGPLSFPAEDFHGALLLPGLVLLGPNLGWAPGLPSGCSLESPVVSWLRPQPTLLEVAGIESSGRLRWSTFGIFVPPGSVPERHLLLPDARYRAAALLRPGELAAVARDGVYWVRCGERALTVWATTRAALGDAVACFPSPLTRELLVVCAEGDVVRVPLPG